MKEYHKLVRDEIPRIIEESGKRCEVTVLTEEEYLRMADRKLKEELDEYLESGDIEELADLLEVLRAAAKARGSSIEQVEEIRVRKARERGGFEKRLCLEKVWTPEEDPMLPEEEKHFEMLDWNAPEEIQELGRRKAAGSVNIRCFLQPVFPKYSKNVWTNCALILAGKTDEELRPWLKELLRWLQDMNWPGAEIIQERLEGFQDDEAFRQAFGTCMLEAVDTNDEDWAENLETVRR